MTSTPLILPTAVGLLSSSPFGVAMRAAAPNATQDVRTAIMGLGYPPLGYAEVGWMANTVDCHYRHGEDGEDTLASLEFKVTQSAELRTTAVTCPKADDRDAFASTFKLSARNIWYTDSHLYEYQPNYPQPVQWQFREPPTHGVTDPLWYINAFFGTEIFHKMSSLSSAAEGWKARPQKETMGVAESFGICSTAMGLIKRSYRAFGVLCNEYRRLAEGAIKLAEGQGKGGPENFTTIAIGR